eukprot:ctg_194.g126
MRRGAVRRAWSKIPEEMDTSTEDPGKNLIMELGELSEALGALETADDSSAGMAEGAGRMLRCAVATLFAGTEQSAQPEAFVSQFGVACVAPAELVIYRLSRQLPRGEAAAALQRTAEAITTALERFLQPPTDAANGTSWSTSGWRARVCHWAVDLLGTVMRALRGDAASVRALFDRLIDRVPWAEGVAVPLQDVFTACHEVLLVQEVAEPTVGSVDARLAAKLLADCAHWPDAVEFPGLVRAIAASLRAIMEQASTLATGANELNASRQVWSAALRRLFAVAPDDALPDMWCVLEMEAAATPALATALLTSMHRDEAQSALCLCEHSGRRRHRARGHLVVGAVHRERRASVRLGVADRRGGANARHGARGGIRRGTGLCLDGGRRCRAAATPPLHTERPSGCAQRQRQRAAGAHPSARPQAPTSRRLPSPRPAATLRRAAVGAAAGAASRCPPGGVVRVSDGHGRSLAAVARAHGVLCGDRARGSLTHPPPAAAGVHRQAGGVGSGAGGGHSAGADQAVAGGAGPAGGAVATARRRADALSAQVDGVAGRAGAPP